MKFRGKTVHPGNFILLLIIALCLAYWVWDKKFRVPESNQRKSISIAEPVASKPLDVPKDPFSDLEMTQYRKILVLYSTGNFEGAVKAVEQQLNASQLSEGFKAWLTKQLPILLTNFGWMKIKSNDCDDASKIFYRILSLEQVPEAQKGLGYCLRVMKNWPEAASYLTAYVLARPEDAEGRLIYADTLESLGRFDDAVAALEGALFQEKRDESVFGLVKERLEAMRAKARSATKQQVERSDHFYISFRELDHEDVVRPILEILENTVTEYTEVLGILPSSAPIEVILYSKDDFKNVIPGGPGWAEGIFDGRIRVPVSKDMIKNLNGTLSTILRHELTHAFLSQKSGGRSWPTWFDEGLAQYMSCRKRECDGFHFPATPGTFTMANSLSQPFVTLDSIEAGRAYLHSLYMIRSILGAKSESGIELMISKMPQTGTLTSDLVAQNLGWNSFDLLWDAVQRSWIQRTPR